MVVIVIIFLVIAILLLLGRQRLLDIVEGLEAVHKSAIKAREENWRQLSKIWSGRRGGLRLLILIVGFLVLIVTFALLRVSGMLIWVGVLVAWMAFVTVVLSKEVEVRRSPSSDDENDASNLNGTVIAIIVYTIILIVGLLFFSNATNHSR